MKSNSIAALVFVLGLLPSMDASAGYCERMFKAVGSRLPWIAPKMLEYSVQIEWIDKNSGEVVSKYEFPLTAKQSTSTSFTIPLSQVQFPGLVTSPYEYMTVFIQPDHAFLRTGIVYINLHDSSGRFAGGIEIPDENTMVLSTPSLSSFSIRARARWVENHP